ncbi:MAG: Mur ligase domain-containing protein [Puniceicoccales bacterium]|jgi:UDP-N-acetylmuramyl pentapeptide synthase|nr:Mur ligase domain-containing protein [Puniceicoccales bacterium]
MAYDLRSMDPAAACGGRWVGNPPDVPIFGAAIDSRKISGGEIFVAIATDRDDGHRYLDRAAACGAAAAIVERPNPSIAIAQLEVADSLRALRAIAAARRRMLSRCEVIAVAGSYGKTTTKELLALLLGRHCTFATEGNLNNSIGVPLSILRIDESVHSRAVFEVGISHPGEMATIAEILAPQHVIFTGLSEKHLEFFPSKDALLEEKLLICGSVKRIGGKIALPRRLAAARQFLPFRENILLPATQHAQFVLPDRSRGFSEDFSLCLAICDHFSIGHGAIAERLSRWRPPHLRGEIYRHLPSGRHYYVDCYNSDLPALLNGAWTFMDRFKNVPRLFALGSMEELGPESEKIHRNAGRRLQFSKGDRFVLIGGHVDAIAHELLRRGLPGCDVKLCCSHAEMKLEIDRFAGAVFLKGSRIHQMEMLVDFANCEKVL